MLSASQLEALTAALADGPDLPPAATRRRRPELLRALTRGPRKNPLADLPTHDEYLAVCRALAKVRGEAPDCRVPEASERRGDELRYQPEPFKNPYVTRPHYPRAGALADPRQPRERGPGTAAKAPWHGGNAGHQRGYAAGELLDYPESGPMFAVACSAAREGRARRIARQWAPETKGRRLLGSRRDRRNPLVGRQADTADTWTRVCRYNAELGIGRPAPSTAAGFRDWLKRKAEAMAEAAAKPAKARPEKPIVLRKVKPLSAGQMAALAAALA